MDTKDKKNTYLENIIGLAPGNVYWKDRQGRYLGCNNNFADIVKLPNREAIVGKSDYDLMSEELADLVCKADQEIMTANEERELEEFGYDIHGKPAIYLSKKVPLRDDDGNVIGILGTSLDITERKTAENNLKKTKEELEISDKNKSEIIKNNEFLSQIIDLLPCNIYWKNREGIYLGCNKSVAKMMGWASPQEVVGKNIFDFYEYDIAVNIHTTDENIMSSEQEMALEETGYLSDGSGKRAIYLTRKVPLYDAEGKITGLLGISFDITDRKLIEQALIEAKQQVEQSNKVKAEFIQNMAYLKNVIAVLPGNIYWKNKEGKYLGCNETVAKILKLNTPNDIIGKDDYELLGEDYASLVKKVDQSVIETNAEVLAEEIGFDIDGNQATYLTRKTPLHNENGDVIGLLGVSLDISEQKRHETLLAEAKERAEAASQAKSNFLAVVSHELRIPLTGILGMAQLLDADNLYSSQREQLGDLIKSGEHLLSLINDLLDIAKLEAGKMDFNLAPVNLRKIIEEMATIISCQAKLKGLELLIDYPQDVPSIIMADARALRQVILNLAGNAIKFTDKGHIIIRVTCIEQSNMHATFVIEVEDTGIGISADKKAIIFDRFAQADNSRTRRYGGTGLGLAITKEYVEAMGGAITVESEINKGAIFTCLIPFELHSIVSVMNPWEEYRSNVRILIIDDTLRGEVLRRHIASSLCKVSHSKEALNVIRVAQQAKEPFDIVIVDQQIENFDPIQLCREIKQQPKLHQPMMLLLAAKQSITSLRSIKETGFYDVLTKPIQPIETLIHLTAAWEKWKENSHTKEDAKLGLIENSDSELPQILLIEDEPVTQRVHTIMLQKLECHVDLASNGEQALALFSKKYYDLVFLDIGLPDIDGFEVASKMRSIEVERGYTPIIGITGYNTIEDKEKCFLAGMDDVAIKPVKPEEMKRFLVKCMNKNLKKG